MKSNNMMKKMATSCNILNDVLRDQKEYERLKKNMKNLEKMVR